MAKIFYYPGIHLEGLRKSTKTSIRIASHWGRNLNPWLSEYKAEYKPCGFNAGWWTPRGVQAKQGLNHGFWKPGMPRCGRESLGANPHGRQSWEIKTSELRTKEGGGGWNPWGWKYGSKPCGQSSNAGKPNGIKSCYEEPHWSKPWCGNPEVLSPRDGLVTKISLSRA
jgi:hypothetical protein